MGKLFRSGLAAFVLVGAINLLALRAEAQRTYFIDEVTDYTGNSCPNITDVNTITASLETALTAEAISWTGARYVNGSAWATDFFESCSSSFGAGGQDNFFGDTGVLSVFAGHGSPGILAFGFQGATTDCSASFSSNMRLGQMGGLQTGFAVYLVCDAITVPQIALSHNEWARQQFAFTNSVSIGNNEPRDFYNTTLNTRNVAAWLDQMDGGGRHPIVVTHGFNQTDCNNTRNVAKLKGNVLRSQMGGAPGCGGGGSFWFCHDTI